jgi:hypothetical protein
MYVCTFQHGVDPVRSFRLRALASLPSPAFDLDDLQSQEVGGGGYEALGSLIRSLYLANFPIFSEKLGDFFWFQG